MAELSPLDELLQKGEQARLLIMELRQTVKDARRDLREMRAEHEKWVEKNAKRFTDHIEAVVAEGLQGYDESVRNAIDKAQAAVDKRFDVVSAILLGEEKDGKPSMAELALEVRRVRDFQRGKKHG